MRRFVNMFYAVLFVAIFSGSPVFSSENEENTDKMITGILVKVDVKNLSIFIKENSRIVKFKTSSDICLKFKDKLSSEVNVTYKISNNKSLQIITIVITERKPESDGSTVKINTSAKKKKN